MPTISDALRNAAQQLSPPSARLDAEVLLTHVLGRSRAHLFAWPERPLTEDEFARYKALIERRRAGEPTAYITGSREFWSLSLRVTPATLIPRPDTERLVEAALERIAPGACRRIADLGTGSGAIALALATERPHCRVVATDRSLEALEVARGNAARCGLTNVVFRRGHWFAPLRGESFDVIVSNPPYVRPDDVHLTEGDVRFEPREALVGGPHGLEAIREIVRESPERLEHEGWLLIEHGYDQGAQVRDIFQTRGFRDVITYRDLGGQERVTAGRR